MDKELRLYISNREKTICEMLFFELIKKQESNEPLFIAQNLITLFHQSVNHNISPLQQFSALGKDEITKIMNSFVENLIGIKKDINDKENQIVKCGLLLPSIDYLNWMASIIGEHMVSQLDHLFYYLEYKSLCFAINTWLASIRKNTSRKMTPDELFQERHYQIADVEFEDAYIIQLLKEIDPNFEKFTPRHIKNQQKTSEAKKGILKYIEKYEYLINEISKEKAFEILLNMYPEYAFYYHTNQVSFGKRLINYKGYDDYVVTLYNTDDLLSLAWVEILWAMNNCYYVNLCKYCGKIYTSERLGGKMNCGKSECIKKYQNEAYFGAPK